MLPEHIPVGDLFAKDCTYTVPLFQRPYVWNEERWELLWEDVARVADEALTSKDKVRPHFLGSVVLQQRLGGIRQGPRREVIDGQQRLTTLQLLFKAVADAMKADDATDDAARPLQALLANQFPPKGDPEAAYKVWPTNVDRASFRSVMDGNGSAGDQGSRIAGAYAYFRSKAAEWLADGPDPDARANQADALSATLRQRLWLIALNLGDEDQAQVIFETLNARGTPLLPADLVKNLLLRQAEAEGADTAALYAAHWQFFDEDPFWRSEIGRGHAVRTRVDLFLQHALQVATGRDVATTNLYNDFRVYLSHGQERRLAADHLASFAAMAAAARQLYVAEESDVDRPRRTAARLRAMDFQTAFPVLLDLHTRPGLPHDDVEVACTWLESFLVRRMVCGLSTRSYSKFFGTLLEAMASINPVAPAMRDRLLLSDSEGERWPADDEFGRAFQSLPLYRTLRRDRLTMVLRALEAALHDPDRSDPVAIPKMLHVEHVMPRAWQAHWPVSGADATEQREVLIDTIGNMTLLKSKLNQSLANAPWTAPEGETAKQDALKEHGLLTLNLKLSKAKVWDEAAIITRGASLLGAAVRIWPRPA